MIVLEYGNLKLKDRTSRTNLLFSLEKMALRDAVRTGEGARILALGLFNWLYGDARLERNFDRFVDVVDQLLREQTRVLTWPLVTVFSFIATPQKNMFLEPQVTKLAAERYGFPFQHQPRPNWETYPHYLEFAQQVADDLADLRPLDMIDLRSFIWLTRSAEYE